MKRLLSYIFPFITKIKTDHSGELELSLVDGCKMLDSQNANYSYGSLQRILETGISKIDLSNVQKVLLLGLGGGSIISSLRNKFHYHSTIHAIEFDAKMIAIARDEFNITANENLIIENADAFEFVKATTQTFDLIIVDLFIDNEVPAPFYTAEFCSNISRLLNARSTIIYNIGIDNINMAGRNLVVEFFKSNPNFHVTIIEKVECSNALLVLRKRGD